MSAKKPTRPNRSSLSRREALRAQKLAEERRKRRNRLLIVLAGVVILAIVITIVVVVVNRKTPTPADTANSGTPSPTVTTPQVNPPDGDAQRAWITVPSANTKQNALIVDIHFDYQCPVCKTVEDTYATMFEQLSDQGDIALRYHTRTFLNIRLDNDSSTRSAMAAACVDVADTTKYVAYHNLLFTQQPITEGQGFTDGQLRVDYPTAVGLTGDALATFQQCYDNQSTLQWITDVEQNNLQPVPNKDGFPAYLFGGPTPSIDSNGQITGTPGAQYGVAGTPTLFVQGKPFSTGLLFSSSGQPLADSADALLAILQQAAAS